MDCDDKSGEDHDSSASTPRSDLAVAFAILPDSEAVQGLVLATRDCAAQNAVTTHRLTSSMTGVKILEQAEGRRDMYTVYRSFQDGTLKVSESGFKLFTFVVSQAYPKIADRLLIMRQLWKTWLHPNDPMDLFNCASVYLESSLPWTVKVYHVETAIKLETCGVPRPERSPGGFFRYTVTGQDFSKWIDAFASTYRELENVLLHESKTAHKGPLSSGDVCIATVQLIVLNGFLQSGFMERLLKDWGFSDRVSGFGQSRTYHPCVASEDCEHPSPRPPVQEQPKASTTVVGSSSDDGEVPADCDLSIDSEGSVSGDANYDPSTKPHGSDLDSTSSTSLSSTACSESVPEPSAPQQDGSTDENRDLVSGGSSGSSEDDSSLSEEDKELSALLTSLTSHYKSLAIEEVPEFKGTPATEEPAAPIEKEFQTSSHQKTDLPHLRARLDPALSSPVPEDEREAFLDSVVERIPESTNSKRGWSRKRTARDWLFRRLLDTPVSGMSAAELEYTPVEPNKKGSGVDPMPRGSEVTIRTDDEKPAEENHIPTPTPEDQDTRGTLERIFCVGDRFSLHEATYELVIGLPDARRCCWCCWRLRQWLNNCDPSSRNNRGEWTDPIMASSWYYGAESATSDSGAGPPSPNFLLSGSNAIVLPWIPPAEGMGVPVEFLRVLSEELLGMLKSVATRHADMEQPEECVIA
ncbi:hypothetical protein C8T65DRAFT_755352 [Cerioporus squamosus]|nr:hypothetical protein C8T65DRAFT_755352 [Cerioporus squamosus]